MFIDGHLILGSTMADKVVLVMAEADGRPVGSIERLIDIISAKKPGDRVDLEVIRNAKRMNVNVKLGRQA